MSMTKLKGLSNEVLKLGPGKQILDSFQNKTIRQLLNIPPTHVDRSTTNEIMYKRIENETGKKTIKLSQGHAANAERTKS